MATAGSIVVDLLMRTGAFETDTKRAEQALQRFQKRAAQVGKAVGAAIAVGATAMAAFGASVVRDMAQASFEIDRLSKLANTNGETLQRWAAGAERVGISQEKLADILKDTQDKVGDFIQTGGGAMADFFENIAPKIGVTAEQFRALSGPDALQLYVSSLEKANLSQSDMIFYMEALASDSALLLPLLEDNGRAMSQYGDEAQRVGRIIDQQTLAASIALKNEMALLDGVLQGVKNQIGAQLIPVVTELVAELTAMAERGDLARNAAAILSATLRAGIGILQAYENAVARTSIAFQVVAESAAGAREVMANVGPGGLFNEGSVTAGFEKIKGAFARGQADLDRLIEQQNQTRVRPDFSNVLTGDAPQARGRGPFSAAPTRDKGGGKSKEQQEAEQIQRAYESLMETMRERIALFNTEGEAAKVRYDLEHGALKMLDEASKQALITEAERYDALVKRREADQAAYDLAKEETDRLAEQKKSAEDMLSVLQDEINLIGMSADQQEIWNNLKWAGVEAESELGKAIIQSTKDLQAQRDLMNDQIEFMDSVRGSFKDLFQDIREGESVVDSLKNAFDNLADTVSDIIAQNLADSLFGKQGDPAGGSTGGWFSTLLGAFFGGAKAGGGDVLGSRGYLVGEQGPEMFVPRTAGTIIPADRTAQSMSNSQGLTVMQIFNNPLMADRQTDAQRQREAASRMQRQMARA